MKSYLMGLIALMLVVVLAFVFTACADAPEVGEFSMDEYEWEIENYRTEGNVGAATDADSAIASAKALWLEKYDVNIRNNKIEVAYDSAEECWHIRGIISSDMLGGGYDAIIQKNGDVIAVWVED